MAFPGRLLRLVPSPIPSRRGRVATLGARPGPVPGAAWDPAGRPRPLAGPWVDRAVHDAPDPAIVELRAAALMVARGEAIRVLISGFPAGPGLTREIALLAGEHHVEITPTSAAVPAITNGRMCIGLVVTKGASPGG